METSAKRSLLVGRLVAGSLVFLCVPAAFAQPACTSVTLSPTSATVGGGSTASAPVQVVTGSPAGCRWTAVSNSPWITISYGSSGVVGGSFGYAVAANPSMNQRVGSITVSGTTFAITQSGANCTTSLSPTSTTIGSSGGSGSVTVLSPQGCAWVAAPSVSWITITSSTGTGNGFVQYAVDKNSSPVSRIGSITIGTSSFTITQSGFSCTYSVSPSSASVGAAGGAGAFTVTSPDTCNWTANSNAPAWLSVTSGASGTGTGTVSYNASVNTGGASRSGTISVGSATFTLNQSASCIVTISPTEITISAAASTNNIIRVTTNLPSCERPAVSDSPWLTITFGENDIGSGDIRYSVTANNTSQPRTGNITVGSQVFTVTQIASNCTFSLSSNFASVPNTGGPGRIDVVTSCAWTATANVNWIMITSGLSGTTNGTVLYTVARNPDPPPREGVITIGGAQFRIRQDGTPQPTTCNYAITPLQASLPAAGETGSFEVSAEPGCAWSAATGTAWITIVSGTAGSGNGDVAFAVAANTTQFQRRGTITVAGRTFTLIQEGTACTYALAPRSAGFPSSGGTGTAEVTSPCTWSAFSNRGWIAIASGSPGTGNGTFTYTVAANTSVQSRGGTITVAGQTLDVSQPGVACSVTLARLAASLGAPGGSGTFGVTGTAGCEWTASSDASWLKVTWAAVGGSGTVYYTVDPNPSAAPRSANITVLDQVFALTQESGPVVASAGVVNAASFARTPVSPGLIVTVFGAGMGPDALATYALTPDRTAITSELRGTRVLFDDVAAPILYTSAGQLSAIVPYAVAGKTATRLVVEYNGTKSNAVQLPVAASAPAIFTIDASGTGRGAILNQNGSVNSTTAPAARNSVVQIFATGEGETAPAGVDGRLVPASAATRPILPVTVRIGNLDAPVTYAGSAPGLVAGLIQINARIATNAPLGDAVPVLITIGGVQSQAGVTIVIR